MRRRSQRMDTVIILYFGTSFSSLSYVDCESRGRNTSGQYLRSSNVRAFASGHKRRETRRPLARSPLARSPLGASLRACTEPDRVLDGSPDATRDEIHAPVRRALGCWPSPSSSPWTISARTGKTTRRRRRRQSPSSSTEAHPSAGILRDVPSRDAFASIPRLHRPNARARTNPFRSFAHASSSRPPRVLLAHRPHRHRPLASSLGSPRLARSHRFRVSSRTHLGLLLTAGQSLGGLGGLRFGRFRRHLSFVCDARDGEAASIARAPPPPRARPRGVRSIGGAFVELFTVSFSFQYERVRARWVLCNEETAFTVFFQVSYVPKVRSLSIDKTAIDATNGRVVASDASTAFDRARSASRARTKERWVGAPVRRERCANS